MVYGYARVSTKGQEKNGNSLEQQEQLLKDNGADKIYIDSFTGTKLERPEFNKLLDILVDGDTLIVTKLDRFARSVSQASDLITSLIDKGITVNVLNLGVLSNNSVSTRLIKRTTKALFGLNLEYIGIALYIRDKKIMIKFIKKEVEKLL